ncbi:uncharacterized protein NPIL_146271 [Nephila pilipes]|uniref:Uncharacterized protein n=1 Tax=Nephila pilipes TaxID=299642 RepID=A0A8X6Q8I7_NEPPI|nr:uncharacterized protein NPIL_146271 [Nephila pilipes]
MHSESVGSAKKSAHDDEKCTESENIRNASTSDENSCLRENESTDVKKTSVSLTKNENKCLRRNANAGDGKHSISSTKSENRCPENSEYLDEMHSNISTVNDNEYQENNVCRSEISIISISEISERDSIASTLSEKKYMKSNECSDEMYLETSRISEKKYLEIIDIEKCSNISMVSETDYPQRYENIDIEKYSNTSILNNSQFSGKNEKKHLENKESLDNEKNEHLQRRNSPRRCSLNINIFPQLNDTVQNEVSRHSVNRYFCCGSLADGAEASADYTIVLSVILILISTHQFFRNSGDEEGTLKALCFCAICYSICYIKCGIRMKLALEEERRDKLMPWIIFSVLSIFLLLSGIVYICMNNWDELDNFHEDLTMPCLLLFLIAVLLLILCTLTYCTWGVIRLFKSMGEPESHSVMDGIQLFVSGVAV